MYMHARLNYMYYATFYQMPLRVQLIMMIIIYSVFLTQKLRGGGSAIGYYAGAPPCQPMADRRHTNSSSEKPMYNGLYTPACIASAKLFVCVYIRMYQAKNRQCVVLNSVNFSMLINC